MRHGHLTKYGRLLVEGPVRAICLSSTHAANKIRTCLAPAEADWLLLKFMAVNSIDDDEGPG